MQTFLICLFLFFALLAGCSFVGLLIYWMGVVHFLASLGVLLTGILFFIGAAGLINS